MEVEIGIKKFRKRAHLNQTELAKKLNILQANVSKWEIGRSVPSLDVSKKLFELGITVEEFFGIDYNTIHGLVKIESLKDEMLQTVLKRLEQMSQEIQALKAEKKKPAMEARTA